MGDGKRGPQFAIQTSSGVIPGIKRHQILNIFGGFSHTFLIQETKHRSALSIANFTQSFETCNNREVAPQRKDFLNIFIYISTFSTPSLSYFDNSFSLVFKALHLFTLKKIHCDCYYKQSNTFFCA